jgi:hypothetical protein
MAKAKLRQAPLHVLHMTRHPRAPLACNPRCCRERPTDSTKPAREARLPVPRRQARHELHRRFQPPRKAPHRFWQRLRGFPQAAGNAAATLTANPRLCRHTTSAAGVEMSTFMHKALSAVAPLVSVTGSIAVLRAAQLPFPPEWAAAALPQWAIFGALVYTSTVILLFLVNRVFGHSDTNALEKAKGQA